MVLVATTVGTAPPKNPKKKQNAEKSPTGQRIEGIVTATATEEIGKEETVIETVIESEATAIEIESEETGIESEEIVIETEVIATESEEIEIAEGIEIEIAAKIETVVAKRKRIPGALQSERTVTKRRMNGASWGSYLSKTRQPNLRSRRKLNPTMKTKHLSQSHKQNQHQQRLQPMIPLLRSSSKY
jgi:hypothetical protein